MASHAKQNSPAVLCAADGQGFRVATLDHEDGSVRTDVACAWDATPELPAHADHFLAPPQVLASAVPASPRAPLHSRSSCHVQFHCSPHPSPHPAVPVQLTWSSSQLQEASSHSSKGVSDPVLAWARLPSGNLLARHHSLVVQYTGADPPAPVGVVFVLPGAQRCRMALLSTLHRTWILLGSVSKQQGPACRRHVADAQSQGSPWAGP